MHQVRKLCQKIWRGLDTPVSRDLLRKLEDHVKLETIIGTLPVIEPSAYDNYLSYYRDAQAVDIIRKLVLTDDSTSQKRIENAIAKFLSSERDCALTNAFVRRVSEGPYEDDHDLKIRDFLVAWSKNVKRCMGKIPPRLDVQFSGGSTLSDKGLSTTIPDKLSSRATIYKDALDVHRHTIDGMRTASDRWDPIIVRANRFFTVDKDAETDRGCCVEASECIRLQLAVGRVLKRAYKRRFSIDLEKAQTLHVDLACEASWSYETHREMATIDLKSASDTISRELVRALVDEEWWLLLNSLRAHSTEIDGKIYFSEKFSSMGNGFTFELETIIFRTLLETLDCEFGYAYGDDLIVPLDKASTVMSALKVWGFTPNPKKTFCEGPFRESCGGDFFDGYAVRPYYMKKLPEEPQQWIGIHNGLKATGLSGLRSAMRFCEEQIPSYIRKRARGPKTLGDLVIHDDTALPIAIEMTSRSEREPFYGPQLYWEVYSPVGFSFSLNRYNWKVAIDALLLGTGERVSPRDSVKGYKLKRLLAYGIKLNTPIDEDWDLESWLRESGPGSILSS